MTSSKFGYDEENSSDVHENNSADIKVQEAGEDSYKLAVTQVDGADNYTSLLTGTSASFIIQYATSLAPKLEPYVFVFPGQPYNVEYRNREGFLYLQPRAGEIRVLVTHDPESGKVNHAAQVLDVVIGSDLNDNKVTLNGDWKLTV